MATEYNGWGNTSPIHLKSKSSCDLLRVHIVERALYTRTCNCILRKKMKSPKTWHLRELHLQNLVIRRILELKNKHSGNLFIFLFALTKKFPLTKWIATRFNESWPNVICGTQAHKQLRSVMSCTTKMMFFGSRFLREQISPPERICFTAKKS